MSRPLQRILRSAKPKIGATNETSKLLMLLANNQHKAVAKVVNNWLRDNNSQAKQKNR